MIPSDLLEKLSQLRRQLHINAELSGNEKKTVTILNQFIRNYSPDKIIPEIGKTGIAYIYNGIKSGPVLLIRADLDAVPIQEPREIRWASINAGVSHKCGHDGHMAILAGLAAMLSEKRTEYGKVVLLFQPSEENGKGAFNVINDKNFSQIEPDYAVALHNIPGFEMGTVLLKKGTFSLASKGIRFAFYGISSHACEQAKGINPLFSVTEFITAVKKYADINNISSNVTVCHVQIGEPSFGLCPGFANVYITVRAQSGAAIQTITDDLIMTARKECEKNSITLKCDFHDEFPETSNNSTVVDFCKKTALTAGLKTKELKNPFSWSEDFGYFTSNYKGTLVGLGSGLTTPPLHHPNYDFPDELIPFGVHFLFNLTKKNLKTEIVKK